MHPLLIPKQRSPLIPPESASFHIDPPHLPSKLAHLPSQTTCECQVCRNPNVKEKSEPELQLDSFFDEEGEAGEGGKDFVFLLKKLIPCKGS